MHNLNNYPRHLLLNQAREARVQIDKLEMRVLDMTRDIETAQREIAEHIARETACNEAAEKVGA